MTMLDVLKDRLIDGLKIVTVKETGNKYRMEFEYDGDRAKADLPKTCSPNCENEVAEYTIITAMSTIYINRNDLQKAKEWLDKLTKKCILKSVLSSYYFLRKSPTN